MGHSQSTDSKPKDSTPEAVTEVRNNNMEHKPGEGPAGAATPIQCSEGASSEEKPSTSIPVIVLPGEDPLSSDAALGSSDSLMSNTDFLALKQFVDERISAGESQRLEMSDEALIQLIHSVARVFAKFPSNEQALEVALQTIPLCGSSLPKQASPILTEVQMNALEALSDFDFASNPPLIDFALELLMVLWQLYSSSLPASCNIKHLARFIIVAITPELGSISRVQEAIVCATKFVSCLMRVLSDSQIQALAKEGVFKQLRLLMMHYDKMSLEEVREIVIGVGLFAELMTSCSMEFLEDHSYVGLVQSALKYPSNDQLQAFIWQLFAVLCKYKNKFAESLFETDFLSSILMLIESEGCDIKVPLRFLTICCQIVPSVTGSCLHHRPLMTHLLGLLKSYSTQAADCPSEVVVTSVCDLLAGVVSRSSDAVTIMNLQIINHLEDCAQVQPDVALVQACIAIESLSNSFPPTTNSDPAATEPLAAQRREFSNQNHHIFFKDMLSHPVVSSQSKHIKLMYTILQKLLRLFTPEGVKELHAKDFLEFFSVCFIRDIFSFPDSISRIVFSTHYFVFEMRQKEPISYLNELNFHTTVANLLQDSFKIENIATVMGLLSCLVGKYYEYLKDIKPFLKVKLHDTLLDKAKVFGRAGKSAQFCDDFSRVMLNLTADKDLSLELYEQGYLDRLVELIGDPALKDVRRSMIHAAGNIALGGQNIKQILLEKQYYLTLLSILRKEGKTSDPYLISACCRVLHILASGDWAKRKFVECGCVEVLLDVMRTRKDTPEVRWRPLGLLSSMGFMAVTNRRFVLTEDVLDVVTGILKESNNGKVISYTMLIFLGIDELDSGARRLRELSVGEHLQSAMDKPEYRKQAPDLERWGVHVLEKQYLYTVSIPKSLSNPVPVLTCDHLSDWPPYVPLPTPSEPFTPSDSGTRIIRRLLPLDDASFQSFTPLAPELTPSAKDQLSQLSINLDKPLFRVGRMYGSTHGLCSNCDKECTSEELVIRPLSMTLEQYQQLIDNGWYRRGGVKMFRLRHNHNLECCDWETRVSANDFNYRLHKSYKKVLRRMPVDRLSVETVRAGFGREAFDLYNSYHIKKHDKPLKSEHSYCEHVANTPTSYETVNGVECGTFHQLYRLDGELVAIGIIDIVPKGMVSIYMWYTMAKEISKYSFGVYSALKEIELVQELSKKNPEMKYYYLQGWNQNNKKLNYKANYEPEEFYCPCIVTDWVSGLDGVSRSKGVVPSKGKSSEEDALPEKMVVEASSESVNKAASSDEEQEANKDEEKQNEEDAEPEKMIVEAASAEGTDEAASSDKKEAANNLGKDDKGTLKDKDNKMAGNGGVGKTQQVECKAFPLDKLRYQQQTGQNEVDVSKVVICLNYTQYMFLEDLIQTYEIGTDQLEILETRLKELFVALSPELRSQLVVDMMASNSAS